MISNSQTIPKQVRDTFLALAGVALLSIRPRKALEPSRGRAVNPACPPWTSLPAPIRTAPDR
jgi:hypothetical protein